MANVVSRNVAKIYFLNAVVKFLSRIVVSRLTIEAKQCFRKLEKASRLLVKTKADLTYLKLCL
jgi:hypothetical protein